MYIFFDIGGTKARITSAESGESFNDPHIFETPQEYGVGISFLVQEIERLQNGNKIDGIFGGIAGAVTRKDSEIVSSPHLLDWVGKPLKKDLEEKFQAPVTLVNDAALVGLGEAHFGAGKGFPIVAYLTVSTGVGGARIVDGAIDRAVVGFEPGHQIIDFDGSLEIGRGERELERLISGTSIEEATGKKPADIVDGEFWDERAKILAAGIANTILYWSPDIVVIGGSMMKKIGVSTEKVKEYLPTYLHAFPNIPQIEKAVLEDVGGLYGALALVRANTYNKSSNT
jgi:predicted NBD/HSP70 family sugar kinase